MTLTQLEYIVAIDTHRHFATAAEHCHVTQPTLSMQIQKLEDELGVLLFDRSKQPVVPTDMGQLIVAQARMVLQTSRRIPEMAQESRDEVGGELRLGIIPTLAPYLLPHFIGAFMKRHPQVTVHLQELLTDQITERLRNGLLDVGIVVTPLRENTMTELPLFREPFTVYAAVGHPLLEKKVISPPDLAADGLWLLSEGHCFREQVLNLCGSNRVRETPLQYETGSLETLIKLIDRQGGFTLLPELATLDLDPARQARIRRFAGEQPARDISLVMHRSFLKRSLINALRKEILAHLPMEIKNV
ncbi:hydrogen peroxide-inducible genes activator [Fibrella aquatilis]|uniref:Hydrogen peroxide-inducible genes activator n=1 Tax=Fibrella aquatilis TaxID=2817059 RepID=A0A939G7T3_9BACT|nr:hydrogen peroxide-inducible genes activator [Fibrella aquatilis]MBO0931353.1 hydrogen peroxide-inducible genes activator [Fibrella aquatilis]